jgi:hypothetical protein
MKSYGDIDLNNNQMQRMALQEEANLPNPPVVGRIAYTGKRVWICAEITLGVPAWIPLTGTTNSYTHDQTTASSSWTVVHNLNAGNPLVQVYDNTGNMLIPNSVVPINNNSLTITFGTSITGRAVIMFGDTTVYPTV